VQGDVAGRAWTIGSEVAAAHADEVDRDARFPFEAVDALRASGLLAAMVPRDLGGEGAAISAVACATRALASHCAATALVFAMHQIEICYLIGHGQTDALRNLLRQVSTDGVLIANANSEVGLGGELGRSVCAVERDGGRFRLEKDILAMSYGLQADAVIANARRAPDAAPDDQVLVACGPGSFELRQTSEWDTIGLRGTGSCGFVMVAEEDEGMILPEKWSTIANHTVGATTILLNSVWLGIAEAAASRAHGYIRAEARRKIGTTPATAPLLAELSVTLGEARGVMELCMARYEAAAGTEAIEDATLLLAMRNLKLSSTTLAVEVVTKALLVCGLSGYKRDSPYSMDRYLRDILGGPLMAHNSRFAADNARLLTALKQL
jgi:acyl-CoA dehydrogenase